MPLTSERSAVEAALKIHSGGSLFADPSCGNAGTMLESECGESRPAHEPVCGMQGTGSLVTRRIDNVP